MTKPTYSELEAELLRVRGLLQRSREALLSCQESANTNPLTNGICIACGAAYDHYMNCVLLSSAAESADIGKLDSAHESGKVNENDGSREPAEWEQNKAVSNLTTPSLGTELPSEGSDEEYARYEQYLYGWKAHEAGHKMMTFSGWAREERKLAGSAETGGEKAASAAPDAAMSVIRIPTDAKSVNNRPGKKSLRKQRRSYRRREKRAVLAQMPYREAGEWAADMLRITPLPTESKTKKFAVEFCKIAIKTYEHKEDAEAFQKDLHRILRRKLRYYAAQEKRALMCKLGFKDRNPEPTFPRSSENQTVSSGVEGAHEGTTADKSGSRFRGEWFCPKCKQKTVNIYLPDSYDEPDATAHFRCENCDWFGDSRVEPTPGSREPEKLNNAQLNFPLPVSLFCPRCGAQHIDEGEWATRSHKTHQCQSCRNEWRPFQYPTVGVYDPKTALEVALAESSLSQNADSSPPKSPEPTGLSIDQDETRAARETR